MSIRILGRRRHRHGAGHGPADADVLRVVLAGSPNVGKSLLFNNLTGAYATVSNYPGTTVEITRGRGRIGGRVCDVKDTPGMYSLLPNSEEERVARNVLLNEAPDVVVHVTDAKCLERMLVLTLQFIEAGLPVVLVLNIMDEAEKRGMEVDIPRLSQLLGVPVVATVSTTGRGIAELGEIIAAYRSARASAGGAQRAGVEGDGAAHAGRAAPDTKPVTYSPAIEEALAQIEALLPEHRGISRRAHALLLLQGDADARAMLDPETASAADGIVERFARRWAQPVAYLIATQRQRRASAIAERVVRFPAQRPKTFQSRLNAVLINPWTGFPILLLVLYLGLYKFVGQLGAGEAVDFLESHLFEDHVNPFVEGLAQRYIPWEALRSLFAGEYGLITLGVRYAVAIILPIVTFFFLVFSIMEDTGYLPRLALLIDRLFKKIGLSGRGVIPIVLGLGCDTMATMVTRTLPTVRERVISTVLLALAVPCSAQLGLILALLHQRPAAMAVWAGVIVGVFLLVGLLTARLLPGEPPRFYMELPPLRLPRLRNVFLKTYTRVVWYLKEVIPLFLLASGLIWVGQLSGLFDLAVRLLHAPVRWIGLPDEAARIFLFGFFRRDYGAAGLYDLQKAGLLTGVQLTVAAVALTLFLPCIAQFLMNVKERGWRQGVAISAFILFFSFAVAFLLHQALTALGATL